MLLSLVIGLALASWAFYLVARAVNMPRMRTVENIAKIDSYGYSRSADSAQAAEDSSPMRGALDDIAGAVGSVVAGRFAGNREQEVRNHLMAAGLYGMTPETLHRLSDIGGDHVPRRLDLVLRNDGVLQDHRRHWLHRLDLPRLESAAHPRQP